MRPLLPCVARCSLLPFCVGCCSVLPLCVAWSSALAARLVASRWSSAAAPQPATALSRRPCQQRPAQWRPQASSSLATMAPLPATNLIRRRKVLRLGQQSGAPGPDLLTRSCGVRPFAATIHISAHLPCCHLGTAAQTDANLSTHLHRLPTPPPYLRRMRLLPGRGQVSDGK